MNSIEQYDEVALLDDIPEESLRRGCVGVVIEKYNDDAFEVAFTERGSGIDYAMVVLKK